MKNINKILASTLIIGLCSSQVSADEKIKKEALTSIKTVAGALQKKLVEKMKEGGAVNAATFCSTNATELLKEVSKNLNKGIVVKRVTDKPRNINNQATIEQLVVFDEIKEKLKNGEKVDMLVKKKSENHYEVYKPILVHNKCLTCHGTKENRNEKAYEVIANKYPNDKAINYKAGDFRGAFLVEITKM